MSRITVDVPDNVLGQEKAKELQALRGKVTRLERKVKGLEQEVARRQRAYEAARNLREFVKDNFDLYDDPYDDL